MAGEIPTTCGHSVTHVRVLYGAVLFIFLVEVAGFYAFFYHLNLVRLDRDSELTTYLDNTYVRLSDLTPVNGPKVREFRTNNQKLPSRITVIRELEQQGWPQGPEATEGLQRRRGRRDRDDRGRRSAGIEDNTVFTEDQDYQHSNDIPLSTNTTVWVHSQMPMEMVTKFCARTKELCPPGLPGARGPIGPDGQMGKTGRQGIKGNKGDRGMTGIHGVKGQKGNKGEMGHNGRKGNMGHDGRTGLPGVPGLDGIPGRHGLDGIPGADGIPGMHGDPGSHGFNGTDGKHGQKGDPGPPGSKGSKGDTGLPGIRGSAGEPGKQGESGHPGLCTMMYNTTDGFRIMTAPTIVTRTHHSVKRQRLVATEGDNVLIECVATGRPKPDIVWERMDNKSIVWGAWMRSAAKGDQLNLTDINRDHMGIYVCTAANGVGNPARREYDLQVYFPPKVEWNTDLIGVMAGEDAVIECGVEFFPKSVVYWMRKRDKKLLENGGKFRIETTERNNSLYKVHTKLTISNMSSPEDFGFYICAAKNDMAEERGEIELFEKNPRNTEGEAQYPTNKYGFVGSAKPIHKSQDDLCPASCKDCEKKPCYISKTNLYHFLSMVKVEDFIADTIMPGPGQRDNDCRISKVGKPVYHHEVKRAYGTWMSDLANDPNVDRDAYWVTNPEEPKFLYEYKDKKGFREDMSRDRHPLAKPFQGTAHIIYNGSFYYHEKNTPNIVRYNLKEGTTDYKNVPKANFKGEADLLYDNQNQTYMDFNVDENGLWLIYGLPPNNFTVVMKFSPETLEPLYMLNISINHHFAGDMFIACGILYMLESTTKVDTKIGIGLDLYERNFVETDLKFTNPFQHSTTVAYNPLKKELYSWDKGNQLTYPVKHSGIGIKKVDSGVEMYKAGDGKSEYYGYVTNRKEE